MKVIESIRDNRTGVVRESEGNISTDLGLLADVAQIIEHQRARERGEVHVFQGRFTTIAIRIEL